MYLPSLKWWRGSNPLGRKIWVASRHLHECTASDVQIFRDSALNSYSTHSDATLLWDDWENRDGMLVQGATRRNMMGSCVEHFDTRKCRSTMVTVLKYVVCSSMSSYQ